MNGLLMRHRMVVSSMSTLKNIVERLRKLETERNSLLLEIDELKKMADAKAKALESEVGMLREELKSLKVLLGVDESDLMTGRKIRK
jgi:hypothetical protein